MVHIPISVDTFKPKVALASGADIINSVSGGLAASRKVPYIFMHSRGTPHTMGIMTEYPECVTAAVVKELKDRLASVRLYDFTVVLDPGLGFAKAPD